MQPRSIRSRTNTLRAFPLQRIAFNSTQLAPVVHRRCRGGLHSVASTPRAPNHHRSHETISHGARWTALLSAQPHLSSSAWNPSRNPSGGKPHPSVSTAHANPTSHPASVVDPRALPVRAHAHARRHAFSLTKHLWSWRRLNGAHVARDQRALRSSPSTVHSAPTPAHSAARRRRVHRNPHGWMFPNPGAIPRRGRRV
jgi:hypothetical protein